MGYELSIQRESEENKISIKEWSDYINSDNEFDEIGDDQTLTIPTPNAGLWKSENGEVPFTFDEEFGWISVKNPDDWIIEKMISIADSLNAVVLGEEEEKYDNNYLRNGRAESLKEVQKNWWEIWK